MALLQLHQLFIAEFEDVWEWRIGKDMQWGGRDHLYGIIIDLCRVIGEREENC
jgi:hypothetical protein